MLKTKTTRETYLARFPARAAAIEFEEQVLGGDREHLPPEALAVLDGGEATPDYWQFLIEQLDAHDAAADGEDTEATAAATPAAVEAAEDWWESLGYSPDGYHSHPVVGWDDLEAALEAVGPGRTVEGDEAGAVLDALRAQGAALQAVDPRHLEVPGWLDAAALAEAIAEGREAVLQDLLRYAIEAHATARAVEDCQRRAIEAHARGDLEACTAHLDELSAVEGEYGDDPAAQHLRAALLPPDGDEDEGEGA